MYLKHDQSPRWIDYWDVSPSTLPYFWYQGGFSRLNDISDNILPSWNSSYLLCNPSCNQKCFGVSWELPAFLWNMSNILLCPVLCCALLTSCIKYPFLNYQIDTKNPLFEWMFGTKFQKITPLACSWNSQLLNWTPCTNHFLPLFQLHLWP